MSAWAGKTPVGHAQDACTNKPLLQAISRIAEPHSTALASSLASHVNGHQGSFAIGVLITMGEAQEL